MKRWAIRWMSFGQDNGHWLADGCNYHLFRTKKAANEFIREHYGYIAKRKDLRSAPHNWRMPKAVLVGVSLAEVKRTKGSDNG